MSSPERDKHLAALANLEAFCEAHNEKNKASRANTRFAL